MGFTIESIHAFVAVDEKGDEGVAAFRMGDHWFPMVAADERRLESLKKMAKKIAMDTGKTLRIMKFTTKETIGEIAPD